MWAGGSAIPGGRGQPQWLSPLPALPGHPAHPALCRPACPSMMSPRPSSPAGRAHTWYGLGGWTRRRGCRVGDGRLAKDLSQCTHRSPPGPKTRVVVLSHCAPCRATLPAVKMYLIHVVSLFSPVLHPTRYPPAAISRCQLSRLQVAPGRTLDKKGHQPESGPCARPNVHLMQDPAS